MLSGSPGYRLLAVCLGLAGTIAFGISVASMARYRPFGVREDLRDKYEQKLKSLALQESLLRDSSTQSQAKAAVNYSVWDFGIVDPGSIQLSHSFRVQNTGKSDLVLRPSGSTCKCTVSNIKQSLLAPGDSTAIEVVWNTGGETTDSFEQSAFVETNDRENRVLEFKVTGTVAAKWRADQAFAMVGNPIAGQPMRGSCLIDSQLYPSFVIVETVASSNRLVVESRPAEKSELVSRSAVAGYRLQATFQGSENDLSVNEDLRVHLVDPESGEEEWITIPFAGRYRSPIAFFGPDIEKKVGFRLGVVEIGSPKTWSFNVRFRGDQEVRNVIVKDLSPESLDAKVIAVDSVPNTFRVTIALAENAEPVRFQGEKQGYVEIADADRPEVSDWMPLFGQVIDRVDP